MSAFLPPLKTPRPAAALRDAHSERAEARWVAALALGTVDGAPRNEAVAALIELVADPVDVVRMQAIEGLMAQSHAGAPIPKDLFERALDDPSAGVRMATIDALAGLNDPDTELIVPMLDDPLPEVRAAAAGAFGRLPELHGAQMLRAALEDPEPQVREEAAHALVIHGDLTGERVLLNVLSSSRKRPDGMLRRWEVVIALGNAPSALGRQALAEIAGRRGDLDLRALAAAAICRSSEAAAAGEMLRGLLHSRWNRKAEAALGALHLLPCECFLDDVVTLARSKKKRIAASAITVLGVYYQQFEAARDDIRAICMELKARGDVIFEDELQALESCWASEPANR